MKIRIQSSSSVKLPQSICSYWLLWTFSLHRLNLVQHAQWVSILTCSYASKLQDWEMSHCLTLSQMAPVAHAQTHTLLFPECCCFFSFMECPYLFNYTHGILRQLPFLTITDVQPYSQLCLNADRQWWPLITIQLDSVLLEVATQLYCYSQEMKQVPRVQHSIRIANYRFKTSIFMHN